jgi:iron(III) transport system substrate-binding protein
MMKNRNQMTRIVSALVALTVVVTTVLAACAGATTLAPSEETVVEEEPIAGMEAGLTEEPAEEATEEPEAVEAVEPDDEKVLSMYVAYGGPDVIAAAFEEATGIRVELLTMSSGEVLARLQAEKANPQTDVWFGGGSDAFIQAKEEGLITAYRSPNAGNVDLAFRDEEGYWTGVSLVVVGLLVNDDRLSDKGLPMPETWAELGDPVYADELMASNPNTSGTAYTTVSGLLQVIGEEQGWAFLDEMYANIPYLEKSGSGPATKALEGEFAIGIVPDPHNSPLNNPDAPLTPIFPTDGVLAWPSPVAIINGAKHPNNARIFVDWALSPQGQRVLMEASPRVPTTDVETVEGVPSLSDLNLVAYDHIKWGLERERVIDEFNERYPQYQ